MDWTHFFKIEIIIWTVSECTPSSKNWFKWILNNVIGRPKIPFQLFLICTLPVSDLCSSSDLLEGVLRAYRIIIHHVLVLEHDQHDIRNHSPSQSVASPLPISSIFPKAVFEPLFNFNFNFISLFPVLFFSAKASYSSSISINRDKFL